MPETGAEKITGQVIIAEDWSPEIKRRIKNIPDYKEELAKYLTRRVSDLIEIILAGAFYLEASDVHFETEEKGVKFRLRVDGVLHDILVFDYKLYNLLLARVKLLSELKLNITSRPQDGRFSIFIDKLSIEVRTSSLPTEFGETIVMRVLNPKWVVSLESLGLRKDLYDTFSKEIQKPNGMIIATGPTGSGKTTTLYAMLQKINDPKIKIITIEDPIEYHLKGISQSQVDPRKGYDFANGLRAIVRQDPDVIMVGEIRDLETVQISIQASLTGHLVVSTVHTNDAAGTIARLSALGEKLINIAPSLNMAIAQRLVRKICTNCMKKTPITPQELSKIKTAFKDLPKNVKYGKLDKTTKLPRAVGCRDCNFTGYKQRTAIFEAFVIDDEMEKFILEAPSIVDMRKKAIGKGMVLMYLDGLLKVLEGITTIEEVERVTEPGEEIEREFGEIERAGRK